MTLRVKSGKTRLSLWIPNFLTGFVVKSIIKHEKEKGSRHGITVNDVDKAVIKQIVKSLRKAKKEFGKLELISVNAADGTHVKIVL